MELDVIELCVCYYVSENPIKNKITEHCLDRSEKQDLKSQKHFIDESLMGKEA